jgi:predicted secreted hydrolase
MDREWSTSALSPSLEGWDWFALQLSDSTELMLYRLRTAGGATDSLSGGTFVDAAGQARTLHAAEFEIVPTDRWSSPIDGTSYPTEWTVRVPALGLDLEVRAVVADQEMDLTVRYWEGAVDAVGNRAGRAVRGVGYVELTGYDRRRPSASR